MNSQPNPNRMFIIFTIGFFVVIFLFAAAIYSATKNPEFQNFYQKNIADKVTGFTKKVDEIFSTPAGTGNSANEPKQTETTINTISDTEITVIIPSPTPKKYPIQNNANVQKTYQYTYLSPTPYWVNYDNSATDDWWQKASQENQQKSQDSQKQLEEFRLKSEQDLENFKKKAQEDMERFRREHNISQY